MAVKTVEDICKEGLVFPVEMGSLKCKLHNETHKNCEGCPSHDACKEYVSRFGQYVTAELKESGDLPESFEWG